LRGVWEGWKVGSGGVAYGGAGEAAVRGKGGMREEGGESGGGDGAKSRRGQE